jgi:hypothetical protein
LTANGFITDAKGKSSPPFQSQNLYDLNKNHEIGTFWQREDIEKPMQCEVTGRPCKSKIEFEALVKPLMEE